MTVVSERLKERGYKEYADWARVRRYPQIPNLEFVKEFIAEIKSNPNAKVFIDPDSDTDGILSALNAKLYLIASGVEEEKIYMNMIESKRHVFIDLDKVLYENFTHVIIVDSSSNLDREVFRRMCVVGTKVLVIDHHIVTEEPYKHKNFCLINNKLEDTEYSWVSAGFLTYLVFREATDIDLPEALIWGWVTNYSDSTPLTEPLASSIVRSVRDVIHLLPEQLCVFLNRYNSVNRNLVSFHIVNKLNASMRSNRFDLIYQLIFEKNLDAYEHIEEVYQRSREMYKRVVDLCTPRVFDNFFIASLDVVDAGVPPSVLRNYTGLICQELGSRLMMPGLTYISDEKGNCKGSVRDPFNRDLLRVFSHITDCGGHKPAFGVRFRKSDLNRIVGDFLKYSSFIKEENDDDIYIDLSTIEKSKFYREIEAAAWHNEIAGFGVPTIYFRLPVTLNYKIKQEENRVVLESKDLSAVGFNRVVSYGDIVLLKPTMAKEPKLYIM